MRTYVLSDDGDNIIQDLDCSYSHVWEHDLFLGALLWFLQLSVWKWSSMSRQVELQQCLESLATEICRVNESEDVALDLGPCLKRLLNECSKVPVNSLFPPSSIPLLWELECSYYISMDPLSSEEQTGSRCIGWWTERCKP
uniref:Uncharacterized protein n=1 Tax=Dromaius novaehollandiae TaxID=8790 RepID=A0A8C4K1K6_DRONO